MASDDATFGSGSATLSPPRVDGRQSGFPATELPIKWNLADLRKHLGGIPLQRIRLYPPPGMATERDALEIQRREGRVYELIDGTLVEKAMGYYESVLAGRILQWLNNYLDKKPLGVAAGEAGYLRMLPKKMRAPDVSFISWKRFPKRKLPRDEVFAVVADLAIEILSPGNTPTEMALKLKEYFRAGVRLVWYIDPQRRRATIYRSLKDSTEIDESGTLDGGKVLQGFRIKLKTLFARAPRE